MSKNIFFLSFHYHWNFSPHCLAESKEEVLSRSRTRIGFLCLTFFFFFEFWSPTTIRQLPCSWWLLHLLERFFWPNSFFPFSIGFCAILFSLLNFEFLSSVEEQTQSQNFQYLLKSKNLPYLHFICSTTANKFSCLLKPKKPHFTATKYSFLFLMAIEEKKVWNLFEMKRVNGVLFSSWGF